MGPEAACCQVFADCTSGFDTVVSQVQSLPRTIETLILSACFFIFESKTGADYPGDVFVTAQLVALVALLATGRNNKWAWVLIIPSAILLVFAWRAPPGVLAFSSPAIKWLAVGSLTLLNGATLYLRFFATSRAKEWWTRAAF